MPTTLERLQYGFDHDSRRTWRRRVLTTGEDDAYSYDGLSQVVRDARGNLNRNETAISAVPASEENWDYDPTGNWRGYEAQVAGSVTLNQHRVHDKGNRLTQIEGDPNSIILDRAGRMLQVPPDETGDWDQSLELKWDAWGRITQVKYAGDEEALGNYAYDGLTRRITKELWDEPEEEMVVHHSYFSRNWRPLEERKAAATAASMQYLWGARHRDDLVRRDRDVNDDGSLDETRYVLMDYFSPASIVDETGAITERYGFSAFGIRRIMAPDFSPRSTSECAWEFAFQGQFVDVESGLLNYGLRYYSPHLGRWTEKDSIGEKGGANLYSMVRNTPTARIDLYGQQGEFLPMVPSPFGDLMRREFVLSFEVVNQTRCCTCQFKAIISFWIDGVGGPAYTPTLRYERTGEGNCTASIGAGEGTFAFGDQTNPFAMEPGGFFTTGGSPSQYGDEYTYFGAANGIHVHTKELVWCGDEKDSGSQSYIWIDFDWP